MNAEINQNILEAAATWYVDLQDACQEDPAHQAHKQWLNQHPSHRQAWARVEKLQQTFERTPDNVSGSTLLNARASRRNSIKALSMLLITAGSGALAWQQKTTIRALASDYHTGIGESQSVTLADGALLQLNTDTSVDVNYNNAIREIRLYSGEIQITTAPDPQSRPFIVETAHGSVLALGTRFLVHSENGQTKVSVLEQAVEIRPRQAPNQVFRIEAGEQITFTATQAQALQTVDDNAGAWTRGLLIVSDWSLDEFLTELSRYHSGRLSFDASIAKLRISGAFNLDNTQTIIENLATTLPLKVHYFTRYWIRIENA